MKLFKVVFMVMLSAIVLVGCKKKAAADAGTDTDTTPSVTKGIDFDALSKDMCACTSDLLDGMAKMEALTLAGDTAGIEALNAKMEAAGPAMEACIAGLEAKYPGVDGNAEYEAQAQAALEKNCPDFAKMMNAAGE